MTTIGKTISSWNATNTNCVGAARKVCPYWSLKTMTCHSFNCFSIVWGQGQEPLVTSLPSSYHKFRKSLYMLWFNFILGLNFIFLSFKLIIVHYHTQKQRELKFKLRIKLKHNIYIWKQAFGKRCKQGTKPYLTVNHDLFFVFFFHVLCPFSPCSVSRLSYILWNVSYVSFNRYNDKL